MKGKHRSIKIDEIFNDYLEVSEHLSYFKQLVSDKKFWLSKFKGRSASSISRADIQKVHSQTRATKSPATCNRHLAAIRAVYNHALNNERVDKNPCKGIKAFQENNLRDRWLTKDEESRLLTLLSLELRQVVIISMKTGLRKTEQFSLKWSDIDLSNRRITVRKSKSGKKGYINMCQSVIDAFKKIPKKIGTDEVFWMITEKDPKLNFKELNKTFNKALKEAGIQDFRWHDLRHTFASRMVMKGKSLLSVSKLMRHFNINMTMRYAHLDPMYLQDSVNCLDNWNQVTPEVTQTVRS